MTFERALDLMRKGYLMKLKDGCFVYYIEDNKIRQSSLITSHFPDSLTGILDWSAIMSNDWEIYNG